MARTAETETKPTKKTKRYSIHFFVDVELYRLINTARIAADPPETTQDFVVKAVRARINSMRKPS